VLHRREPERWKNALHTKNTAIEKTEENRGRPGRFDDGPDRFRHRTPLHEKVPAQSQEQAMPHVSEHEAEHGAETQRHEKGWIHFSVGGQAVDGHDLLEGAHEGKISQKCGHTETGGERVRRLLHEDRRFRCLRGDDREHLLPNVLWDPSREEVHVPDFPSSFAVVVHALHCVDLIEKSDEFLPVIEKKISCGFLQSLDGLPPVHDEPVHAIFLGGTELFDHLCQGENLEIDGFEKFCRPVAIAWDSETENPHVATLHSEGNG
jgi:hypothetical protein